MKYLILLLTGAAIGATIVAVLFSNTVNKARYLEQFNYVCNIPVSWAGTGKATGYFPCSKVNP